MTSTIDLAAALDRVRRWLDEGRERGRDAAAELVLATVDATGRPDLRIVPCRGWTGRGPILHTDVGTAKVRDMVERPSLVAAHLSWPDPRRQVRLRATAVLLGEDDLGREFARRDLASQRRAWARAGLDAPGPDADDPIPPPPTWTAVELVVDQVELWEIADGVEHRTTAGTTGPGPDFAPPASAPT